MMEKGLGKMQHCFAVSSYLVSTLRGGAACRLENMLFETNEQAFNFDGLCFYVLLLEGVPEFPFGILPPFTEEFIKTWLQPCIPLEIGFTLVFAGNEHILHVHGDVYHFILGNVGIGTLFNGFLQIVGAECVCCQHQGWNSQRVSGFQKIVPSDAHNI